MSLYGKMAGGLIALTLVGGSAAYVASAAGSVLEAAEQTAAQLSINSDLKFRAKRAP